MKIKITQEQQDKLSTPGSDLQRDALTYGGFLDKRSAEMVQKEAEAERKRGTQASEERLRQKGTYVTITHSNPWKREEKK